MTQVNRFILFLSIGLLILAPTGGALAKDSHDYVEIAKTRLVEIDEIEPKSRWFYTTTARIDGETLVTRNHPDREEDERRELISVDGKPPTPERLAEFNKKEAKRSKNDKGNRESKFNEMVDFDTLKVMEVTDRRATLSFTPVLEGFEKDADKLVGNIVINTDTLMMEEFGLMNTEKVSPAFSVSFSTFRMKFWFAEVDGTMLYSKMETLIKGKAGFLKKIEEGTEITFSDYQRYSGK